jgi:hypothetical protein
MKFTARATATLIAIALLGSGNAFAATADQLSPAVSSMTCGEFSAMTTEARLAAMKDSRAANATTSLSTTTATDSTGGGANSGVADAGAVATPGTMITGGQLIAACQAAPATQTVGDAYSAFSTGSNGAAAAAPAPAPAPAN